MKISLDEFEHQIDEKILKRGFDYFKKGNVVDVNGLGGGEYEISVEGSSDIYTVHLNIQSTTISEFACDCPYDNGPVCKHVVAALFYLQKDLFASEELTPKTTQKKTKTKSAATQTKELLDKLSHEELKAFVQDICTRDKRVQQLFLTKYIHFLHPESKELYRKQIHALVKTYADRYGNFEHEAALQFNEQISNIAADAMANIETGNTQKGLFIAMALFEETRHGLKHSDDGYGVISTCISAALNILTALATAELNSKEHDEVFNYLLFIYNVEEEFVWHYKSMEIAIKLVETETEKEKIKLELAKVSRPREGERDWDYRETQELMLALIQKTEGEDAARQFMEADLTNPEFRAKLIEKALKDEDYKRAEWLAKDGIEKEEKKWSGRAHDWRNYLLQIYMETKDVEKTKTLLRGFIIEMNEQRHPFQYYYTLLKQYIPESEWQAYINSLINELKTNKRWNSFHYVSQLHIWEMQWEQLFDWLKHNLTFENIASLEPYLSATYANELATFYKDLIIKYMEENVGREHYRNACRYIRRMIKLKARPMAMNLIDELKKLYPTRRAMIEELNNI